VPTLLAGVDRAAFVAALVHRLRTRGVDVGMTSAAAFTEALAVVPPVRVRDLYWSARITLVSRQEDLAPFDRVFDAAFADAVLAVDPNARRTGTTELPERPSDALAPVTGDRDEEGTGSALPWHTLPRHVDGTGTTWGRQPGGAAGAAPERGGPDRRHPAGRARRAGARAARPLAGTLGARVADPPLPPAGRGRDRVADRAPGDDGRVAPHRG
jgi:hypothetical protein